MILDLTPAQLISEVTSLTDKNKDLSRELSELRKDRILLRESTRQVAQYEAVLDRVKDDNQSLQAEVARLRRANEDFERKFELEVEEHSETRLRWIEKEEELRRAVLDEKAKARELKELASSINSRQNSPRNSRNFSLDSAVDVYPTAPPSPVSDIADFGIGLGLRRESSISSLKNIQEENEKLKATVAELTVALEERDRQIKRLDGEIIEYQRALSALMDDLEAKDELAMLGYGSSNNSDDSDGQNSPSRSPVLSYAGLPLIRAPEENGHRQRRRVRSKSSLKSVDLFATEENDLLHEELRVGRSRKYSDASSPRGSLSRSRSSSPSDGFSNSLASELEKLGQLGDMNLACIPSDNEPARFGEDGYLRARLEAVGLNPNGNRKTLKKRLQAYIKRKERQLFKLQEKQEHPERVLKILQNLNAARS